MSLVNYSSDEEDEDDEKKDNTHVPPPQLVPSSSSSAVHASASTMENVKLQAGFCSSSTNLEETSMKLPDASELFASFESGNKSIAMNIKGSAVTSAKRSDLNGSDDGPRKKIPKGNLLPSRTSPDMAGGLLLPPQLRGRSNVATEDLDKLFTRRPKSD